MGNKAKRKNQILPIGTHVEVAIFNDGTHLYLWPMCQRHAIEYTTNPKESM